MKSLIYRYLECELITEWSPVEFLVELAHCAELTLFSSEGITTVFEGS